MILGILLVVLIPLFIYSGQKITSEIKIQKAYGTVDAIASAADSIYALGPGSKRRIHINMPDGVQSTEITDNYVIINIATFGEPTMVSASSNIPEVLEPLTLLLVERVQRAIVLPSNYPSFR